MKILLAILMTVWLTGCSMDADSVQKLSQRCVDRNGKTELIQEAGGGVLYVHCHIGNAVYYQGDF